MFGGGQCLFWQRGLLGERRSRVVGYTVCIFMGEKTCRRGQRSPRWRPRAERSDVRVQGPRPWWGVMTKIVTQAIPLPGKVLRRFYTTADWLRLVRQERKRMEHRERLCLMAQDSERACVAGDKASERFSAKGAAGWVVVCGDVLPETSRNRGPRSPRRLLCAERSDCRVQGLRP